MISQSRLSNAAAAAHAAERVDHPDFGNNTGMPRPIRPANPEDHDVPRTHLARIDLHAIAFEVSLDRATAWIPAVVRLVRDLYPKVTRDPRQKPDAIDTRAADAALMSEWRPDVPSRRSNDVSRRQSVDTGALRSASLPGISVKPRKLTRLLNFVLHVLARRSQPAYTVNPSLAWTSNGVRSCSSI